MRRHQIESAAFDVATQVRSVEDAIETALSEIAELQSRMIHARAVAGVATMTGHGAMEHLAQTVTNLVTARGGMAHCHAILKETTQLVPGLRTVSFGAEECPPNAATAPLRVVA